MQYIPGSSVTLSASLSYLQKNLPLPDDSELQTRLPQICVDYLSHEWLEEDVWKSWRNMTRHKSEIANGVRLENASWRTWWKQRNNLSTVSPETLNWLKDSDVTWLYGPLHTAAEPVPPAKQSTAEERLNLVKASGKKPILKHRTITELLHIQDRPGSPGISMGSPALESVALDFSNSPTREGSPRPVLPHARSDTQLATRKRTNQSPSRVVLLDNPDHDSNHSRSMSPAHSDGLAGSVSNLALNNLPPKRHISFNTFVEQCISIDDPSANGAKSNAHGRSAVYDSDDDLIEDDGDDDEVESSTSSVLEMHSVNALGDGGVLARRSGSRVEPSVRSNSTSQERERMTIAPIPPTLLKASEELPAPSPQVVYAPPKEFLWDTPTVADYISTSSPSIGSSSSSDNLTNGSGSITGTSVDMGFVAPQWGRPNPPPGTVGIGTSGPVGPGDTMEPNVYATVGYEEPTRPALPEGAISSSPSRGGLGIGAGRSKWVPGSSIPDDDEDSESESVSSSSSSSSEAIDSSDISGTENDRATGANIGSPPTIVSTSSSSASRTVVGVPLVRSPPATARTVSSRAGSTTSSQPGKSILKKGSTGGASSVGSGGKDGGSTSGHQHSEPIEIPKAAVGAQQAPSAFSGGMLHMPATATISTQSTSSSSLSPRPEVVVSSWVAPTPVPGGRGRTSTRSASSSGISDRSRSSSKISGTSSPLGSVSPSGYGSPNGSRAGSVLGNRRSSTDVGRSSTSKVGRSATSLIRQSSTSPPTVSSPLANSIAASTLGTIVANVPMDDHSPPAAGERGPPLSRSGIANAKLNVSTRPRVVSRSNSDSSASSSSSGTMAASRTPRDEVGNMGIPVVTAPLQVVKKVPVQPQPPAGEPRPTVITNPDDRKALNSSGSATSSGGQSPSGGGAATREMRDMKLEAEMNRLKAEQEQDQEDGAFDEYASTNPTPSNSPVFGLLTPSSKRPTTPDSKKTLPISKPSPSTAVITTTSATTSAITATSTSIPTTTVDESGLVGKAADSLMTSAKGLLGAIWGMGDGQSGSK